MTFDLTTHRALGPFLDAFAERHLDEMTFLLGHRLHALHQASLDFTALAKFEKRLLAHLRAWQVYGARAEECALARIDDETEVRGAVYALGSLPLTRELSDQLVARFMAASGDALPAWQCALRMTLGVALDDAMHRALSKTPSPASMLEVLGWRRALHADRVLGLFEAWPLVAQEAAATALARLDERSALPVLRRALARHPESIPLLRALLMLGDDTLTDHARKLARQAEPVPGALCLLASCGDLRDADALLAAPASEERLLAMGILGAFDHVRVLCDALTAGEPSLGLAAALSLERITGAGLFAPGGADDDDEAAGAAPSDPACWASYLEAHGPRFARGRRYRRGVPFELARCVDELADATTPYVWRVAALDEWRLRGRRPTRLEPDDTAQSQLGSLDAMRGRGR